MQMFKMTYEQLRVRKWL